LIRESIWEIENAAMTTATYAEVSWERMSNAVEKVRQRLLRVARALEQAKVPYAVADGNAVARVGFARG
jgi:hypothetical protein